MSSPFLSRQQQLVLVWPSMNFRLMAYLEDQPCEHMVTRACGAARTISCTWGHEVDWQVMHARKLVRQLVILP